MVIKENKWKECDHTQSNRFYKVEDDVEIEVHGRDYLTMVWGDVRCGTCGAKLCLEEIGYYKENTNETKVLKRYN